VQEVLFPCVGGGVPIRVEAPGGESQSQRRGQCLRVRILYRPAVGNVLAPDLDRVNQSGIGEQRGRRGPAKPICPALSFDYNMAYAVLIKGSMSSISRRWSNCM
jgi:hypothetical protein